MSTKENNFGLIRIIAAILVVAGHMYVLLGSGWSPIFWQPVQSFGIAIFFVCGGYLITLSWKRDRNYLHYMIKRITRIIPPLAVYVIIAACIVGPIVTTLSLKEYFNHELFRTYFSNILLYISYSLPGVFENNPYPNAVNGSLWCLPVEFLMYIFIPLIYEIGKLCKGKVMLFLTGMICLVSILYKMNFQEYRVVFYSMELGQVLNIIPFYFIGAMVAIMEIKEIHFNPILAMSVLILAQLFIPNSEILSYLISLVAIPYFVFAFAFGEKCGFSILANKWDISYGIFLYGFLVQQLIIFGITKNGLNISTNIIFMICLFISTVMGILSSKYVETPMKKVTKYVLTKC